MRTRASCSRGFTLMELMITVAVLAVLAALAAPSLSDFFDRNRVRAAADDVVSLISNARAEAVRNDLDVNIAMRGSGTAWCVGANAAIPPVGGVPAAGATECNCANAGVCLVSGGRQVVASADYTDVSIGALPAAFDFNSTLGAIVPLGDRTVTLTSPTGKYDVEIRVNALGQAFACTPATKPVLSGMLVCE
ncbi:prepilin-type N-terminal cleavage/methylation domain-containing protein [Lysobacter sp. A6]|uniref:Prepilin-type N-terminal cleavage/methylation domain-containing protein n=1 Tax=Noviluteimonas lactosilytica TaxID=2888523 RepID=A0ABS8JFT6_9GAMM|nr:GspH/FimT family pseudopilin [Lysobacter lactosilyticus]MCC8362417.1 prepilin-type N-terminal cleavage/methylation domain-containing protein [Lysobacter lactosilyticus]